MGVLFPQERGTFQGSPLSPLLYVLFLVDLILYVNGDDGSAFHGGLSCRGTGHQPFSSPCLSSPSLSADDIALLATSIEQMQQALELVAHWAELRGIKWGYSKCKVMRLSRPPIVISPSGMSCLLSTFKATYWSGCRSSSILAFTFRRHRSTAIDCCYTSPQIRRRSGPCAMPYSGSSSH